MVSIDSGYVGAKEEEAYDRQTTKRSAVGAATLLVWVDFLRRRRERRSGWRTVRE